MTSIDPGAGRWQRMTEVWLKNSWRQSVLCAAFSRQVCLLEWPGPSTSQPWCSSRRNTSSTNTCSCASTMFGTKTSAPNPKTQLKRFLVIHRLFSAKCPVFLKSDITYMSTRSLHERWDDVRRNVSPPCSDMIPFIPVFIVNRPSYLSRRIAFNTCQAINKVFLSFFQIKSKHQIHTRWMESCRLPDPSPAAYTISPVSSSMSPAKMIKTAVRGYLFNQSCTSWRNTIIAPWLFSVKLIFLS